MSDAVTLVISDTHLGRRRRGVRYTDALEPLIASCSRIIVNGDLADVFHPGREQDAARAHEQFGELCARYDVEPIILSGNHDPTLSIWRAATLADGQVYITHGDSFHPASTPWGSIAEELRAHQERFLALLRADHSIPEIDAELIAAREANFAEWRRLRTEEPGEVFTPLWQRPWAVIEIFRSWSRFHLLAARFADRHQLPARFIIFGHTHKAGVWSIGDRTVINTGCFGFPGRPRAVRISGRDLTIHVVRRRGGMYRLTEQPTHAFKLSSVPSGAPEPSARNTRDASGLPIVRSM